jgi:flagellar hook-associated protein 3 FlgL
MTIISKSMFPLKTSYNLLAGMKDRYDKLQQQLATGQRASTLAEMGSSRFVDISMRARVSRIDSYQQTMATVGLRLEVLDTSMSRLDSIEAAQRTSATPGGMGSGNINLSTVPTTSRARLDEVIDILNAEVAGRYLFAGGETDKKPVASSADIMNGVAGRAGFLTVAGERALADRGDGLGRLEIATTANQVELGEDSGVVHPFGLKLSTLSSSSTDIVLGSPSGTPPALSVTFNTATLPVAGSTVTLGFTLPDGSEEAITLTAVSGTPGEGEFQIGIDGDTTAANFAGALDASIRDLVDTRGAAASMFAAADNFFNGQGEQVMRVSGTPATATTLTAATAANTVLWYTGEDSTDPRGTVNAKVDDRATVRYGVQANESGLVSLVRSLAAMAASNFPNADATSGQRFDAMATRQVSLLSEGHNNEQGSIEVISVELSLAKTTIGNSRERQNSHKVQLETMLADIETIPPEEVSMEILALKVRLEASYEATSLVAQLSLVNYLP